MRRTHRVGILVIAVGLTTCLDMSLTDELNWPDGGVPGDGAPEEGRGDGGASADGGGGTIDGAPGGSPDGSMGVEDAASDTTPPWLVPAMGCAATETTIGSACVSAGPYGFGLRLWASEPVVATVRVEPPGVTARSEESRLEHHLVVSPLSPATDYELSVRVTDGAGLTAEEGPNGARTGPLTTPIVINEVLHDPLGTEPHQEFVELLNIGMEAVSIDGWTLEDEGGADALVLAAPVPADTLVVIVPAEYQPGAGGDPVPGPGAVIVRLEGAIGAQGLRNSGESLLIRDAEGEVVSRFSMLMSPPGAGISIERVDGYAPDGDPANWRANASESSTPGRVNSVAE